MVYDEAKGKVQNLVRLLGKYEGFRVQTKASEQDNNSVRTEI